MPTIPWLGKVLTDCPTECCIESPQPRETKHDGDRLASFKHMTLIRANAKQNVPSRRDRAGLAVHDTCGIAPEVVNHAHAHASYERRRRAMPNKRTSSTAAHEACGIKPRAT
jgi:hypothetical protein